MPSIWDDFLNLIFPPKPQCPFCGRSTAPGDICGQCRGILQGYRKETFCERCGRLPAVETVVRGPAGSGKLICDDCRKRDWPFVLARAGGPYEGILREALHHFKYAGQRSLAPYLAVPMAEAFCAEPYFSREGVDLVIPVPLSKEKLRQRGFNQAALLAREVGNLLQIPVGKGILLKDVETLSQAGLNRSARESNLAGAFSVARAERLANRNILIVDDVFTTGSTLAAVAAAVLAAGANRVSGLTTAAVRSI
ncbi:MAG: DNA utilization protein GntX [Firmicutes bacterium ADurb.Bin456]|nr:MAG: DNA utilization protein GntX [Firmicutes bacterium ADurb.Bin456]